MINCIIYEDNEMIQLMYREAINYFFAEKKLTYIELLCIIKRTESIELRGMRTEMHG